MTSATGKSRSFTFIEILVVIIIIGILTGISLPNLRKTLDSLQLYSFSRQLQTSMNYARQRAIVEEKNIFFYIDTQKKEYWARLKDADSLPKTYKIPDEIDVEAEIKEMVFYPDGTIDKVTITLTNRNNQQVSLTTKGVYGQVKLNMPP